MTSYIIPKSPAVLCQDDNEYYETQLSNREVEIIIMIYSGLSQKEIAARLELSPNTIRNHVTNACQKVGASSSMGLLQWYIDSILFIKFGSNFVSLAEEA